MKFKAQIEVNLKPFMVPNFVLSHEPGEAAETSYPLSAIDPGTLAALCDEFTKAIFTAAGKSPPPQQEPRCRKCGQGVRV